MSISNTLFNLQRFVESHQIEGLEYQFTSFTSEVDNYFDGMIHSCDFDPSKKCWIVEYTKNEPVTVQLTFEDYVKNHLTHAYFNVLERDLIQTHLIQEANKFRNTVAKVLDYLYSIALLSKKQSTQIYGYIASIISTFIEKLKGKYIKDGNSKVSSAVFEPKITWLVATSTLSSFLLDYSSENNNLRTKLFERDIDAFKNLMLNCFVDEKGNPFSTDTINTYFDSKKQIFKLAKRLRIKLEEEPQLAVEKKSRKN